MDKLTLQINIYVIVFTKWEWVSRKYWCGKLIGTLETIYIYNFLILKVLLTLPLYKFIVGILYSRIQPQIFLLFIKNEELWLVDEVQW